jgi:hypothetical protein
LIQIKCSTVAPDMWRCGNTGAAAAPQSRRMARTLPGGANLMLCKDFM